MKYFWLIFLVGCIDFDNSFYKPPSIKGDWVKVNNPPGIGDDQICMFFYSTIRDGGAILCYPKEDYEEALKTESTCTEGT